MKRLTCTLAALALVMAISIPASAEFKGTLQRNQPWLLEIVSGSVDPISATVYYLGRDVEVVEIVTVPAGEVFHRNIPKPGRGVRRVVVDVDPVFQGTFAIRVNQGAGVFGTGFESFREGDTFRWVFDVD